MLFFSFLNNNNYSKINNDFPLNNIKNNNQVFFQLIDGSFVKCSLFRNYKFFDFDNINININSIIILLYDITIKKTFEHCNRNIVIIRNKFPDGTRVILVGNKFELNDKRMVSFIEGENLAKKYNCDFIEISCKNKYNITKLIETIILDGREFNDEFIKNKNLPFLSLEEYKEEIYDIHTKISQYYINQNNDHDCNKYIDDLKESLLYFNEFKKEKIIKGFCKFNNVETNYDEIIEEFSKNIYIQYFIYNFLSFKNKLKEKLYYFMAVFLKALDLSLYIKEKCILYEFSSLLLLL